MAWAPDYCTSAELKAYERIDDTADDAQLALAISAASRAVDRFTNRQFGLVASVEARYYTPKWHPRLCRWVVPMEDLMTSTGLVVMADLDDSGEYASELDPCALKPVNAAAIGRPWTELVVLPTSANQPVDRDDSVEITAKWGWATVPDPIKQATLLQASRFFARRNSPFGIAGSDVTGGSELRLLSRVDPDVGVAVGPYVRQWGAV